MAVPDLHPERHLVERIGWLRAAVLGANDGIVSTASLIVGVAAAAPDRSGVLLAGAAGLVAGAMSMAAGNMSRSARRPTPRPPIWRANARNWRAIPTSNSANWRRFTSGAASTRRPRTRSPGS